MTPEEQRAELVRNWWVKAEESLASAQRELEAGACVFSMNRVYYAAFYAATAALLDRQLSFRKHSGVRSGFHREFVKTGLLDVALGKLYDQLWEDREEGDYLPAVSFEHDYVESQLLRCRELLTELRPLVASLVGR